MKKILALLLVLALCLSFVAFAVSCNNPDGDDLGGNRDDDEYTDGDGDGDGDGNGDGDGGDGDGDGGDGDGDGDGNGNGSGSGGNYGTWLPMD